MHVKRWLAVCMLGAVVAGAAHAEAISVAVASNFLKPLRYIGIEFEARTGHTLVISAGSTGNLYTQILNGAPYEVFLAADEREPARLERDGLAVPGSRFTYAVGRLALWSADPKRIAGDGEALLRRGAYTRLAIANPKTAPYGAAAMDVLRHLGLVEATAGKLVRGENIGQTFQFVASGNADLGFVALAQVREVGRGNYWEVPAAWHVPVRQQAVLTTKGKDRPGAAALLEFLHSEAVRELLVTRYGYDVEPGPTR